MARGSRTVNPGERNKGLSSTFQPPEEGQSVQLSKCCDKHGDKDEDNSQKNVNYVHNTSSQKYRGVSLKMTGLLTYSSALLPKIKIFIQSSSPRIRVLYLWNRSMDLYVNNPGNFFTIFMLINL